MELVRVTLENWKTVKTLVASIFPVSYSEKFFVECLENDLSQTIIVNNEAIAFVSVKPENFGGDVLYVRSLGVHPLFRENGIGTRLIEFVEKKCEEHGLKIIMLHVQISNKTAIKFYESRGFRLHKLIPKYYQRCEPADAYVMLKNQ
ncbi:unnamed protein product [Caenorhabditis angaria]|uniref:N-terminal methionine N(alpha)-acetyltransferase NatE n=1 Tax=Caenorhabditis angaria TaxID=860376 RepID=A0A9P1IJS8_9PELO|nr:unnamed protein product [Caenorhabditis angaria]